MRLISRYLHLYVIINEMEPGQHLTFTTTTDNDFPHLIQLYSNKVNILGSDNYSWSAYGTSSATLDVTLPDWWGNYTLVIRAYNPGTTGIANLTYTERYDSQTWTREYINNFVGGNTLQVNHFISGNSFWLRLQLIIIILVYHLKIQHFPVR